jgi:hypothetical protein
MDHDTGEPTFDDEAFETSEAPQPEPLPPLPLRLLYAFVSPGKLTELLAKDPKVLGALLVVAIIAALSVALIPVDVMVEMQRQAALERGTDMPELPEQALTVMRIVIPVFTVVSTTVFALLISGFYALVFAFILGDEGRFKQYLAMVAHAWFIAFLFGLLITPLRISTGDPRLTVNLASFLFFLPDGYLLNFFRAIDLTQIWASLVIAQGAHAIDPRRSFGSAVPIVLVPMIVLALIAARFM